MILLTHISLAIISLIFTPFLYLYPSKSKLIFSYVLVVSAFASGVYLVWGKPADLIKTCVIGLIYFGLILFGINLARIKLHKAEKQTLE
ncbi:MAG: hypothetical protein KW804_02245 [Candidatus Doudnabacteria bacterium]|nr:hypothetical protein [Candidatus Doudnabacteria bacterium]